MESPIPAWPGVAPQRVEVGAPNPGVAEGSVLWPGVAAAPVGPS